MRANAIICSGVCALALAGCGENLTPAPVASADPTLTCVPDLDGRIDARELTATLDLPVRYLVGKERAVDVAGKVDGAGRRTWDMGTRGADSTLELSAQALGTQWYAASFPGGQFVTPLDDATDGVYAQDDAALWLLGVASRELAPAQGKTLIVYAAPVAVLRFPLASGATWTAVGDIPSGAGTIRGLPYIGRDTYVITVDGAGRLGLPDVTFTQALRVRTQVTVAPSIGAPVMRRQVSFYFECFGEVARATSHDGEAAADFTTAAELRRLSLQED